MAVVGANKRFRASMRMTEPQVRFPRNVREAFQITRVFENGIFQLTDQGRCQYDRAYLFTDVNYINRNEEEKRDFLLSFLRFLNSMSVDFKIILLNQYRNTEAFLQEIFTETNQEMYPDIAKGIQQWIREKTELGNVTDVEKLLCIVVTVRAADAEEAKTFFTGMDAQLSRLFQAFGSQIMPLHAQARLVLLKTFFHADQDTIPIDFHTPGHDPVGEVLPASVESYKDFLLLGREQYVSVLMARNYEANLDEGKVLHSLSSLPYPSLGTVDYAPVERSVLRDLLSAAHMNNEKAIAQEVDSKRKRGQGSAGISYVKERQKEELEAYQDQIDENDESAFLVGLLVVVTAKSEEELAKRIEAVRHIGRENGVTLETYNFVQLKALNTALPVGCRMVNHMRTFLSSSLVALQPFYAQDLQEFGGILYGMNRTTRHLVFGNRKKLLSPHGMIVGHTGGGKSFLIKETEIAQVLLSTDDDIYMIDPQNEMKSICEAWNGLFCDFGPKCGIYINPLEIPEEIFTSGDDGEKNRFIADQAGWAASFCAAAMKNIVFTQEHRSAIGRCVRNLYEMAWTARKLHQPTLKDLREEIRRQMEGAEHEADAAILRRIYNSLEEYTEGAFDNFAYPSNITLDNRFVVFGLQKVSQEMWELVMITIMHYLSNRMEYNQKLRRATRLIVDETQVVCEQRSSADMLLRAVVTYRKFGGICTLALQNLTRALENPELRDMFSNCGYKCFLDQGGVDAQALSGIQELSETEAAALAEEVPGYAVMVWGKKVILLDARMARENILYEIFSTNFHEEHAVKEKKQDFKRYAEIKKEILKMAALVPVEQKEVSNLLELTEEEAGQVLEEMLQEGSLVSFVAAGTVQYRAREERTGITG